MQDTLHEDWNAKWKFLIKCCNEFDAHFSDLRVTESYMTTWSVLYSKVLSDTVTSMTGWTPRFHLLLFMQFNSSHWHDHSPSTSSLWFCTKQNIFIATIPNYVRKWPSWPPCHVVSGDLVIKTHAFTDLGNRIRQMIRSILDMWWEIQLNTLQSLCFHAGLVLSLLFDPEDGGEMFLRNVGWLSTDYTALYLRRWYSWWPPLWEPQILSEPFCLVLGI
jgi:hypothetical protein